MSFLPKILQQKREEVAARKKAAPLDRLKESAGFHRQPLSLRNALLAKPFGIIAEIKKASPSKGLIRPDFDPADIARRYSEAGARALSVLTDEKFFQGQLEYIGLVKSVSILPVLRKDFIIDAYQLYESRGAGADAVLLIVAALQTSLLRDLREESRSLGLDVLVEAHNEEELQTALALKPDVLGINNRDLHTFNVDFATTLKLAPQIPPGVVAVSESGITSGADIRRLRLAGCRGALIGEWFMRQSDPGEGLRTLLQSVEEDLE
jgi:indole-3-glycerol phosphate synthase